MELKLVHSSHPFIVLRGNTCYFRFTLPSHLRRLCPLLPGEAKRSLHTDSISEAVYLVSHKLPLIKLLRRCRNDGQAKALWEGLIDFSEVLDVSMDEKLKRLTGLPVTLIFMKSGRSIEYGFSIKVKKENSVIYENLLRGKEVSRSNQCKNARIQNVFGGVNKAAFTANGDMESRCRVQNASSMSTLRNKVYDKTGYDLLNVPMIKKFIA
ncbi:MAG: hypothetical protein ACPGF7_02350 [Pontibacterium sp.]